MIGTIKKMLGMENQIDFKDLINRKAVIIDVRSKQEFQSGHIRNSTNIPLDKLAASLAKIPKDKPIITCCRSGMRSGMAKKTLLENGFNEVVNGGGWTNLNNKIK